MNLSHVAVGCVTYRGLSGPTAQLCEAVRGLGATVFQQQGTDVYVGRNILLTDLLDNAPARCSVFLLLDSDNAIALDLLGRFLDFKRTDLDNAPLRSAVYAAKEGYVVAQPLLPEAAALCVLRRWPTPLQPYSTGMGAMAVRREALAEVREQVPKFRIDRWGPPSKEYAAFCRTVIAGDRWLGDDGGFCALFGGAELDTETPAGHMKEISIEPDAETLRALAAGTFFPKE